MKRKISAQQKLQILEEARQPNTTIAEVCRRAGVKPEPPSRPHQRWHTDLMYLWIEGRWYYLCTVLDGYSRYIVQTSNPETRIDHRRRKIPVSAQPVHRDPGTAPQAGRRYVEGRHGPNRLAGPQRAWLHQWCHRQKDGPQGRIQKAP